jgi:hypothetical protein
VSEDENRLVQEYEQVQKVDLGKKVHVTISPPQELYKSITLANITNIFAMVYALAAMIGINGGCVVFHPFRIIPKYKDEIKKLRAAGKFKGSDWKAVHENILNLKTRENITRENVLNPKVWRQYVYFSPHFHVLGFREDVLMNGGEFHKKTGWVYVNHQIDSKNHTFFNISMDLLNHEATNVRRRWFGTCSYNKTKVENFKKYTPVKCGQSYAGEQIEHGCGKEEVYRIPCNESIANDLEKGNIDNDFLDSMCGESNKAYFVQVSKRYWLRPPRPKKPKKKTKKEQKEETQKVNDLLRKIVESIFSSDKFNMIFDNQTILQSVKMRSACLPGMSPRQYATGDKCHKCVKWLRLLCNNSKASKCLFVNDPCMSIRYKSGRVWK